ncbi:MAG: radical SAM/SPASM domain-containing protein [Nanoarchaeota archaeon]
MKLNDMNRKIYSLMPEVIKKMVKDIYYDYILHSIYSLMYFIRYGFFDFFDAIAIETTTYCNLRCENCPNSKYTRGLKGNTKLMDTNLFNKIINELAEINYRGTILLHFYGEPLTDKRIPYFVQYIKKKLPKSFIQINTNGFLLTLPLYKELLKSGLDRFFITQYTSVKPKNIDKIISYLKDKPKKDNLINYRVLGKDIGLSNRGGEIKVDKCVDFERPICLYPTTAIHIDYFGNLVLCCNDYHSSVIFGNIKNEKLLNIWDKPSYKKLRKELRKKNFYLSICKKCVGRK